MTTKIDVGTPPRGFQSQSWESVEVCFHNFANDPAPRGTGIKSPDFTCLGHRWYLDVYPRGEDDSNPDMVAVFLYLRSDESIKIDYHMSTRGSDLKELAYNCEQSDPFEGGEWNGSEDFAERTTLLEKALVKGTLTIEVRMRLSEPSTINSRAHHFIPSNPIYKNILSMFLDEESSDVVFEVGPAKVTKSQKKAKPSPVNFSAHRIILRKSAPALAEMCWKGGSIAIADVEPEIFRHALYYVYGGKVSHDDMKANAKEIIDAADKFGIVNLKLEAEACYVDSTTIDVGNMMDNLLYADSKNCALLKEAVIDFVVEHDKDVLEKVSLHDVPAGMFADLLTATARAKENDSEHDRSNLSTMRVSELRKRLDEKGLEVDGSRESMIKILKEHSTRDNADDVGQDQN
ncbi:hypothetical protein ACHAWF_012749 [Thalassiosira exigua]